MIRKTTRSLTRSAASAAITALIALPLVACADQKCTDHLKALSESVDGVESAEFECVNASTHNSRKGTLHAGGVTEDKALIILENVLKTYARDPEIDRRLTVRFTLFSKDESVFVGPPDLGFNGNPPMYLIREHYRIEPDDS